MALFTGNGDDGTTTTFEKGVEMSKASRLAEALGTVDELNSFLGICKTKARSKDIMTFEGGTTVATVIERAQKDLFIIQAELGGAGKTIEPFKTETMEAIIHGIEDTLPKIDSFFIAGGDELSAHLSTARAITRRAERRIVEANHAADGDLVSEHTLAFINRLSSLMYALARRVNFATGFSESSPDYE